MSTSSQSIEASLNAMSQAPSMQLESPGQYALTSSQSLPPFEKTKTFHSILDVKHYPVQPEIHAKIDKGFFKADSDWTCYRRNYFSVACAYTLKPAVDTNSQSLYLYRTPNQAEQIRSLSMCITAKVDGEEGKLVELVQHTPKRDKGPMASPQMTQLNPHPADSFGMLTGTGSGLSPSSQLSPESDPIYSMPSSLQQQPPIMATFDRIQFKKATANNGKRRAQQQYFYIVVELFAEVAKSKTETQAIKVASRVSAPMVVRGRSPGHYSDNRRGSSTSMGGPGGGSSGESTGGGAGEPTSAGPSGRSHGISGMPFAGSSRMGNSVYQTTHAPTTHSSSGSSSHPSSISSSRGSGENRYRGAPAEPVLTSEEDSSIAEYNGYQYYPAPLFEAPANSDSNRSHAPPGHSHTSHPSTAFAYMSSSTDKAPGHPSSRDPIKEEPHRRSRGSLPGIPTSNFGGNWTNGPVSGVNLPARGCGRFQGMETSRGYYPEMPAL
ncbi:hypothetical protein MMC20_001876 [Loxospora ochrophaea]|nr:hypothetical protein [Loxospora ochrophaea]